MYAYIIYACIFVIKRTICIICIHNFLSFSPLLYQSTHISPFFLFFYQNIDRHYTDHKNSTILAYTVYLRFTVHILNMIILWYARNIYISYVSSWFTQLKHWRSLASLLHFSCTSTGTSTATTATVHATHATILTAILATKWIFNLIFVLLLLFFLVLTFSSDIWRGTWFTPFRSRGFKFRRFAIFSTFQIFEETFIQQWLKLIRAFHEKVDR